jgi:DNA-binding MarR family transcriptional regulator
VLRSPTEPRPVATESEKTLLRAIAAVITLVEPGLIELWRSTGVTFGQRRLLARLRRGPRTAGALAAELGIAAPTVTRQLQKLEDAGLLARAVDEGDRRRVIVKLTPSGERLLADHRVLGGSRLAAAARGLSEKQRSELTAGLNRLLQVARD